MHREVFNNGHHACMMFSDLVHFAAGPLQVNQYMIVDGNELAVVDPGGNLNYNKLFVAQQRYFPQARLKYILCSHPGSQIFHLPERWPVQHEVTILVSSQWERFTPHGNLYQADTPSIVSIPDRGMEITLGQSTIKAIPAPFLHSAGSLQFYDTSSGILFSGDIGAIYSSAMVDTEPVPDPRPFFPHMENFHRRHMGSNKTCRLWARMMRQLNPQWIAPHLGRALSGATAITAFVNWVEQIECGVDLVTEAHYQIP